MRFTKITIDGVRNIEHGEIAFSKGIGPNGIDIAGVYGPNGSGKTTLIKCIQLFQFLVRRAPDLDEQPVVVPADDLRRLISSELRVAHIVFELAKVDDAGEIVERYKYEIRIDADNEREAHIASERLSYAVVGEGRMRCVVSVERDKDGTGTVRGAGVRRSREKIRATGVTSAIFRTLGSAVDCFRQDAKERIESVATDLQDFATDKLFILTCNEMERSEGTLSPQFEGGLLPLYVRTGKEGGKIMHFPTRTPVAAEHPFHNTGYVDVGSGSADEIGEFVNETAGPVAAYDRESQLQSTVLSASKYNPGSFDFCSVCDTIETINPIIGQLVPGLSVGYQPISQSRLLGYPEELEGTDDSENDVSYLFLRACREQGTWDLCQESKGVLKLITIASFLRAVCLDSDVTVVIDELDANIFEYLLGQILSVVYEEGRGQLIFTAHNLHPLEELNSDCIVFTRPDASDRFTRIKNVKRTNNLRKMYLRAIYLDSEVDPQFYKGMSDARIAAALTTVGES